MGRKVSVILSDEVYKGVEDFRRENPKEDDSIQMRSRAIENLLKMGLAARKTLLNMEELATKKEAEG